MKNLVFILFLIFLNGCVNKQNTKYSSSLISQFQTDIDSLNQEYTKIIEPLFDSDWIEDHLEYFERHYPDFTINYSKQSYVVIPSLQIPDYVLEKDNINLLKYLKEGKMVVENSKVYILEDGKSVGTFRITESGLKNHKSYRYDLLPISFHKNFNESNINQILTKNSGVYFEIAIKQSSSTFYLPDLVFYNGNEFEIFHLEDDKIYPASELYRSWITADKEKFRHFINGLVEKR